MAIQIPDLNPLRFIDNSSLNNGFDGNYSVNQLNWYQVENCYFQPWLQSDILKLQIIADEVPADLEFKDQYGNTIDTAAWAPATLIIPAYPDLTIYELEYSFSNLPIGRYEAIFGDFGSEPFEVLEDDDRTILLKYKNSRNDYDTVFDTGIEFNFRIHGAIDNYSPQNEREVFYDQKKNVTQLSSIAWRRFTFTMGIREAGLPRWIIDRYNIISQCDQISYDNVYYQIAEDANIEVEQNFDYAYIWQATVDIEPVDNNFIRYVTQPDGSGVQTFTPVQKVTPFYNVAGAFNVAGVFKYLSKIESVDLLKSGADFLMNIGVTPGGSEIVSNWNVNETKNDIELNYLFDSTQTVYFSGTGLNANALIINWLQLDEPPVPIGQTSPPANLGIGAIIMYNGDYAADFDVVTGLGKQNGAWKDWCRLGTNGTLDPAGKLISPWDGLDIITIGTDKGSDTITIAKANLPATPLNIRVSRSGDTTWRTGGGGGRPITNVGGVGFNDTAETGQTANLGDGTPLPFTPKSVQVVYIIKIA